MSNLEVPNRFTKSLSRGRIFEDYKLTCLNYYVVKGVLPNSVQKQTIMRRICKQYGEDYIKLEKDIVDKRITDYEKSHFKLNTFNVDTIDNYDEYL